MMTMSRKILYALVCVALAALPLAAQPQPLAPVAEISFETTQVGLGATFTWGRGWLTFQGKEYPVKVEGLGLAGLGYAKVSAIGKVYNLNHPMDITGTYAEAGVGIAVVGGVKGLLAKNERGVVIDLTAMQRGLSVNLGVGGFTIIMTTTP
jgi:outer membrane immunogenic protein